MLNHVFQIEEVRMVAG